MKFSTRIFWILTLFTYTASVFAQDGATSRLLDPNIIFALGWAIAAVAMVGGIYLIKRYEDHLKDSLSPEAIELVAKHVLAGAAIAIGNAQREALKTDTPIDDWLVMTGKIGYDQALAILNAQGNEQNMEYDGLVLPEESVYEMDTPSENTPEE